MAEWLSRILQNVFDFANVLNASISASWLIGVVLLLRLMLKKAPKWLHVALWGIVALRLLMPFSIESAFSLIPSTQTVSDQMLQAGSVPGAEPAYLEIVTNPSYGNMVTVELDRNISAFQWDIMLMVIPWMVGMALMALYTAVSYWRLRKKVNTAVILRDNIFQSEYVGSPFVLGIMKPRIYLPYSMDKQNMEHVIAHERAHIRRKDNWWKPLGFLLLTIHWFNPLMWAAYILLCRDIELACDEKVIAELGHEQRADYTQALVACAVDRRMISACPLAFGEVGVKERVKSIMNYRKPPFWIIVTAVAVCAAVAVCFLTDPKPSPEFSMNGSNIADLDPEAIVERILNIEDWESSNIYMNSNNFSLTVDSDFNWVDSQAIRYFFGDAQKTYSAQLRIFPEEGKYFITESSEWMEQERIFLLRHYLDALKYLPQKEIQEMAPADQYIIQHVDGGYPSDFQRVITYSSEGVQETDGWFLHLRIEPLHADGEGFRGTGDEVVELFYGSSSGKSSSHAQMWFDYTAAPERMRWTEELKCTIEEFPGITFKYTPYEIVATTSWEDSDLVGNTILISGMPIWNAYFCDLTGDGFPEICVQLSHGSGMIDNRVIICDYANGVSYKLEDRGYHDYYLRMDDADGYLYVDKRVYNSDELVSTGRLVFKDETIQLEGVSSVPIEKDQSASAINKVVIDTSFVMMVRPIPSPLGMAMSCIQEPTSI